MFGKTHEKRRLGDVLSLPRKLIREVKDWKVEAIRNMWKKTQYVANILIGRFPSGTEYVMGSNHLLDSLAELNPDLEVWVEIVEINDDLELNMIAEAHNYHTPLTQYEIAKIIASEIKIFGEEYVRKRRKIVKSTIRKMMSMADIPDELAPYIPPSKSKATPEMPLTYSHWHNICKIFDDRKTQKKMAWKLINEVKKYGEPIGATEFLSALSLLRENQDAELWQAISLSKQGNKMDTDGAGLDTKEKFEMIESLLHTFNPQPIVVYDVGAKEIFRHDENEKFETEIPRLNDTDFIEKVVLIGNKITQSRTGTLFYARDNEKIHIASGGNCEFYNWLLKLKPSKESCLFIIDFSGLGVSPLTLEVLFKKRPNAHVIMTIVNLFDNRYNKAWVSKFLCDMGVDFRPKNFEEYITNVFYPLYGEVADYRIMQMKNDQVALACMEQKPQRSE